MVTHGTMGEGEVGEDASRQRRALEMGNNNFRDI